MAHIPWQCQQPVTHRDQVTHRCVSKLITIGSDNGLSPGRRQAIICTNKGILLIGPLGTNFSEILIEIHTFSFQKIHLKMSSGKWWPFCLGLNVLSRWQHNFHSKFWQRTVLQNTHNQHPTAHPHWQSMGCSLLLQSLMHVLPLWFLHSLP